MASSGSLNRSLALAIVVILTLYFALSHRSDDSELIQQQQRLQIIELKSQISALGKELAQAQQQQQEHQEGSSDDVLTEAPKAKGKAKKKDSKRIQATTEAPAEDGEGDAFDKGKPREVVGADGKKDNHEKKEVDDQSDVAPEGEHNVGVEEPHAEDERRFVHKLTALEVLPEDASEEEKVMHRAFESYRKHPSNPSNVPVYGTTCIGDADCKYVTNQLRSFDTGIGHVIVVLNAKSETFRTYFDKLMKRFPGRFSFFYRPEVLSCSEGWNIILKCGFSIRPQPAYVWISNGDLWALPGYQEKFSLHTRKVADKVPINRFYHFSSFAMTLLGWTKLGGFDEVIFPAYAEDVEYHLRAVSKGLGTLGSFPGSAPEVSHHHVGSRSFTDKEFGKKYNRWDKNDYMFRKWGVDMRQYTDFAKAHPHQHPFSIKQLSHRKSSVVDPVHRHCIKTGLGPRHQVTRRGGCFVSACDSCWYNVSVLASILPPDAVIPDRLKTQSRLKY